MTTTTMQVIVNIYREDAEGGIERVEVSVNGERYVVNEETGRPRAREFYSDTVILTPEEYRRLLQMLRDSLSIRRQQQFHHLKMVQNDVYRNKYNADMEILLKLDI